MRVFVMHCKVGELTNLLHENKYFIESLVKQYQKKGTVYNFRNNSHKWEGGKTCISRQG